MAIADDVGIDYVNKRVYWNRDRDGSGAYYGFYTVKELYVYLMDMVDELTELDDPSPFDFDSPTSFKIPNQWHFDQGLFKHLRGAGIYTDGYDGQIREIVLVSGGYANCVAGDIGLPVTDDGTEVGVLVDYDNTNRKWWIRTTSTIADGSVMDIPAGSGAGTTTGASTSRGDIQIVAFGATYTSAVNGDVGKSVTDDGTTVGKLLDFDNTLKKWWIRSPRVIASGSTVAVASGTGTGTSNADSAFGEDAFHNFYTLGTVAHGNFYLEQNGARVISWWDGSALGFRKLTFAAGGYTPCVESDAGKTVTGTSTGDTGILLAYDNTNRYWWVRMVDSGDLFDEAEACTIGSGTGAGTTSGASVTAEGNKPSQSSLTYVHADVLVKIKESGTLIDSGNLIWFNRNYGDTYAHLAVTATTGDQTPVPMSTGADPNISKTSAQIAAYVHSDRGGTGATAQINTTFGTFAADVDLNGVNENYTVKVDCDGTDSGAIQRAYEACQWMISKDRTETLNGKAAALYRSGNHGTFTEEPAAPMGYYAGGKMFFAQGTYPINVPTADASNYEAADDNGTAVLPPTYISLGLTGLVGTSPYDKCGVFPSKGSGSVEVKKDEYTSHASNNGSSATTFECQESIDVDKPATGYFCVVRTTGTEYWYEYSSWSGKIFTLASGTLGVTFDATDKVYVPYIRAQASGATISVSLRYSATRNIVVRVRNKGHATDPMKPAQVASSFGSSGASIPISRIKDTQVL